jgi:integral membrane protein (TIGR01906 family)
MKVIIKFISVLITIMVPFILIMTAISLLINPLFLQLEYNLPNFPPDPYGFTTADRLKWGELSMNYLVNAEPDDYLATLQFEDGTALYNQRELGHMLDVRVLVKSALTAWYILLGVLLISGLVLWKTGYLKELWAAITWGGWLTLGLIFMVILSTFIDFSALFTAFHGLFFEGDTWLFYESDTLIRLYPLKFWSDAFIYVGIMTVIGALLCVVIPGRLLRKVEKTGR